MGHPEEGTGAPDTLGTGPDGTGGAFADLSDGLGEIPAALEGKFEEMKRHFNRRVEEAVNARKAYETASSEMELVREEAETLRQLRNSPEFMDFYKKMKSGTYQVGEQRIPTPQPHGNGDQPDGAGWDGFDPVTVTGDQMRSLIQTEVAGLLEGKLLPMLQPLVNSVRSLDQHRSQSTVTDLKDRYPDYAKHEAKINAYVDRYGVPYEDAYMRYGNRVTREQTDAIKRQSEPTPSGFGAPLKGEERARTFEQAREIVRKRLASQGMPTV